MKNKQNLSGGASAKEKRKGQNGGIFGKGRIFHAGLYREALIELRPFGIISAILMLGNAVVAQVAEWINYLDEKDYAIAQANKAENAAEALANLVVDYTATVDYYQFQFMAFVFMLVIVPIMTLYLFSFLNKRNLSDFYHSIPHTRVCLSCSYLLAIVTYIVLLVSVCGLLGAAGFSLLPCEVEIYDIGIVTPIFNVICGSIFMMSVFWLAMSLTGTIFMNLASAALILLIPSCVLIYTGYLIDEFVPYIPFEGLPTIFNGSGNVITGMFIYMVFWTGGADYDFVFGAASTGLLTLLTALVLIIAGILFFRYRKSENAESASIHPVVQSVFRIGAGFLVSMFVTGTVLMALDDGDTIDTEYIFWWVVFYVIAVFIYYLFELVTTRQPRRLLHIWKGLLVLILLNFLWAGAECAITEAEKNWCPDAEDIVSVELEGSDYYSSNALWQSKMTGVTLTSDDTIELVAEALENTIDLWQTYKADPDYYWDYYESKETSYVDTYYYNMSASLTFTIHTKTGTTARTVKMTKEQYTELVENLAAEEKSFAESYTELPDFSKVDNMWCTLLDSNYFTSDTYEAYTETTLNGLTAEQWKNIYDIWCEEAKTVDFARFFYLTWDLDGYTEEYIDVSYEINGQWYYGALPLTPDFPETLSLIASYQEETCSRLKEQGVLSDENILRAVADSGGNLYGYKMYLYTPDEVALEGYDTTYCWEMINDFASYYLELYGSGDDAEDDGSDDAEQETTAELSDGEETAEPESTAEETMEGEVTKISEDGTTVVMDEYSYEDLLNQWNLLADELDNCRDLEFTAGATLLVFDGEVSYYTEEGDYEYYSLSCVFAVSEEFVELFNEYVQMTSETSAVYYDYY
ncbi:MAG: hypothetical protein LUE29_04545 [Lachnospiraceae bacterium]|nr:hypothetical protein [Lachnospiraceae bacterium]